MRVKICFNAKLCTQNKILASKMQQIEQQKTSAFVPLTLKRWIEFYKDAEALVPSLPGILISLVSEVEEDNKNKGKCEKDFVV